MACNEIALPLPLPRKRAGSPALKPFLSSGTPFWMSLMSLKPPFSVRFSFGNRKKVAGAKYGY
jgi:hypothetical protein